jgi:hypothetical protein
MHKFDKLLEKKGKPVSDVEKRAKSDVLSSYQRDNGDALGDKLAGLKKVSVAAPNKEGLEAGLEKAGELLGEMPEEESLEMKPMEECTPEEIDQKIQMLQDYKQQLVQNEQE